MSGKGIGRVPHRVGPHGNIELVHRLAIVALSLPAPQQPAIPASCIMVVAVRLKLWKDRTLDARLALRPMFAPLMGLPLAQTSPAQVSPRTGSTSFPLFSLAFYDRPGSRVNRRQWIRR